MNRTPPKVIVSRLRGLWSRELLLRVVWGGARLVAVSLIVLAIACAIDYSIDRDRETPYWVRVALTATQALLAVTLLYRLVLKPWWGMPNLDTLAGVVETKIPEFGHRLVSALQLNRPGANRKGMSEPLIDDLTREAEETAGRESFARLADHSRLSKALLVAVPVVAAFGAAFAYFSPLSGALVQRQWLAEVEVPRDITIASVGAPVWPAGDEAVIRIEATSKAGMVDPALSATARVEQQGQPAETVQLTFEGETSPGKGVFMAKLPKSSAPFAFRAWVGDGRMREPVEVRFEPRPVVTRIDAWVRLPEFVGKRPDGSLYEEPQPQGEINGYEQGTARVRLETQKPITKAELVLYGRPDGSEVETELDRKTMNVSKDNPQVAEAVFTVDRRWTAYRLEVKDTFGFANANPPRRNIAVLPDELPYVTLLPETMPADDEAVQPEDDVEGMPIAVSGQTRIGYFARSPLGLRKAQLAYRINDGDWTYFPLTQLSADESVVGPFDARRGVFEKTGNAVGNNVQFYPMPSVDRRFTPDGLEGGGRFDFEVKDLVKTLPGGATTIPQVGDRVEFAVETFDRSPKEGRLPGRSDARLKAIVDEKGFRAWISTVLQSESKLRRLRDKQQSVFEQQ